MLAFCKNLGDLKKKKFLTNLNNPMICPSSLQELFCLACHSPLDLQSCVCAAGDTGSSPWQQKPLMLQFLLFCPSPLKKARAHIAVNATGGS